MAVIIVKRDISKRRLPCEHEGCDGTASIHKYMTTRFSDLGNGPGDDRAYLDVRYGVYFCPKCVRFFTQTLHSGTHGTGHSSFTKRVHDKAVDMVLGGKTLLETVRHMHHKHGTAIPMSTLSDWVRLEKSRKENTHGTD